MTMSSNDKIKLLYSWCLGKTKNYKNVNITNFTSSWRNGLGFCAILHSYGPEYIDYQSLCPENVFENCQLAFYTAEKHFGIPQLLNARDMVTIKSPDRLSIITYLFQYYSTLASRRPKVTSILNNNESYTENIYDDLHYENQVNDTVEIDLSSEQQELTCEICSKIIYFLEKLSVSDKYYHRSCYRETQLNNLKSRNKTLERPPVQVDSQINRSNIEHDNSNSRLSRLHSLSSEIRAKITLRNEKLKSKTENESNSDNDSPRKMSHSRSLSPGVRLLTSPTKEINRSNTEGERNSQIPILRSNSTHDITVRPPSLDGNLEKLSNENSPSKSFRQLSIECSSPSASSTHYVSINASSTDSLPKSLLGTVENLNGDLTKRFQSKLYPGSLNTSSTSLNSSFRKKRRAPPPPAPTAFKNVVAAQPISAKPIPTKPIPAKPFTMKSNSKPKLVYPKDLNPFAEFEDVVSPETETNPFAEFMDAEPNNSAVVVEKPTVKPRKRVAPKLPPKVPSEIQAPVIDMVSHVMHEKHALLQRVTSVSEHDISPSLPESSDNEYASKLQQTQTSKDTNDSSDELTSSTSTVPEVKNEDTQTNDLVKPPEPLKRTKHLMEKAKSNDSLNLLYSCRNSKHKPPAPPRPAPLKREVRGDTSHEFITYEALYSELEEINQNQSELETKGRSIQDALKEVNEKDERYEIFLQQWLEIAEKKTAMYAKEHHLHEVLRRQELEDRHSDLEYELRVLMGKQESLKTAAEKAREEELLNQILDTVNARAQLVEEDAELSDKSSTNESVKKKSSLKKIFSCKHRSNSLGKTLFRFSKTQKKAHKTLKNESSFLSRG